MELVGTVLGGTYRVDRCIGRGGLSILYEASRLACGSRYAIKVLKSQRAQSSLCRARLEQEAEAMNRIDSPHVPRIVDALETPDGRPCLVLEMLEGETLQEHLKLRQELGERTAIRWARQVCAALANAHLRGVIHRDIKPSNIFLVCGDSGTLDARVIDFGVARLEGKSLTEKRGRLVGTPPYMAPEQARGSVTDERVDVYGVGATLYRMVTGRAPYRGLHARAVLEQLLHGDPPAPNRLRRDLHAATNNVIKKAMARSAALRFLSIAELDRALAMLQSNPLSS